MKRLQLLLLGLMVFCFAQAQKATFRIEGSFLGNNSYDNRPIRLVEHDAIYFDQITVLDSTVVRNGHFVFEGTADVPKVASVEILDTKPTDWMTSTNQDVILESGTIVMKYDSLGVIITGTPLNNRYNELLLTENRNIRQKTNEILAKRQQRTDAENGVLSSEENDEFNKQIASLYANYKKKQESFAKENVQNPVGVYFFFKYPIAMYEKDYLEYMKARIDPAIWKKNEEKISQREQAEQRVLQSKKEMEAGHRYREIIGRDPAGNAVKLSELIKPGHTTLLIFWASWCAPCREESFNLKSLYSKYQKEGLEILSVSLDIKREAWVKAIKEDSLTWMHVSDLNGWECIAAQLYKIHMIPSIFVLDENNMIVGNYLRGEDVEKCVKKVI